MADQFDNIRIELLVTAARNGQQNIWMQGDLEIYINGEKCYDDGDIIDAQAFEDSLKTPGTYFIYSCSCGIPGCAGYEYGIQVSHDGDSIMWNDLDNKTKVTLDRKEMIKQLHDLRKQAKDYRLFFKKREIAYVGFAYEDYS
jgi:hypothetical protein